MNPCFLIMCGMCLTFDLVHSLIDDLYCGKENCYSVLGVERDSSKADIAKNYRQLARKYHPDKHKTQKAKQEASEKFTSIATAYEVLKDEDARRDYDFMLDHPEQVYGHYYRYYRRRMAPKVDARIVVVVTITVISIVQYYGAWARYKSAIDYLITVPKYRLKATEIAKEENLLMSSKKTARKSKMSRAEYELQAKLEHEAILKKILEEKMDIRGGYSKPSLLDVLWIRIFIFPYTILKFVYWHIRWLWKFTICKKEYGNEEKIYLIQKNLKCSTIQWDAIPDEEKEEFFEEEIWIKDNYVKWKEWKENELKAKYAESARYRSNRRYIKNQSGKTMTFDS